MPHLRWIWGVAAIRWPVYRISSIPFIAPPYNIIAAYFTFANKSHAVTIVRMIIRMLHAFAFKQTALNLFQGRLQYMAPWHIALVR